MHIFISLPSSLSLAAELHSATLLFSIPPSVFWPYFSGIAVILLGFFQARNEISQARGSDKIVALGRLCYAAPLAAFGAEHLTSANSISQIVPSWMPWHMFWTYFVGLCLIFAALSVALRIQTTWSGTLLGTMFFLFVLMMDIPGLVANSHNRFSWILALRELAFAGGAWAIAGTPDGSQTEKMRSGNSILVSLAIFMIAIPAIVYGIEHFLHPDHVPGVPLEKLMPLWIPARLFISYLSGAVLVLAGIAVLLRQKPRVAATYLGALIVALVLLVYVPIAVVIPSTASEGDKIEGLNYIFDTLLFGGTVLALAGALPPRRLNPEP